MKRNLKVIQINGLRGLITACMIGMCLVAGFVCFPGWVAMHAWNFIAAKFMAPTLGLFQGILLWGIIAVSYFMIRKHRFVVSFKAPDDLTEEELMQVMGRVNIQQPNDVITQAMLKSRQMEDDAVAQNHDTSDTETEKDTVETDVKL